MFILLKVMKELLEISSKIQNVQRKLKKLVILGKLPWLDRSNSINQERELLFDNQFI